MKSRLRKVNDHGVHYQALMFVCPGCIAGGPSGYSGLHQLPVNAPGIDKPSWSWDGNLEAPTLSPSIRTKIDWGSGPQVCHSYLKAGRFDFLEDSTNLAGQNVPLPDLPAWVEELA
jgi:hypothetical protein